MIRNLIQAVGLRNPSILSAAVRRPNGGLLVTVGDHRRHWGDTPLTNSTPTHMNVPIALGDKPWGSIEVRFRPLIRFKYQGLIGGSLAPLLIFIASAGTLSFFFYLSSVLRASGKENSGVVPHRVRDTLNTVMEGVLLLDKDERIALANDAFAKTVGVPAEALRGRRASELCYARAELQGKGDAFPWSRAIAEGVPQRGSLLRLRFGHEAARNVSVNSTSILGDDGVCRGALATFDDLTPVEDRNAKLHRLLKQLKLAQKRTRRQKVQLFKAKAEAEASNSAKSEFLANVSHEIRTPMNSILGMTEATLDMEPSPGQRECLEIVKTSADSLLSIINDILDLGKIEAGKFELDPAPFQVVDIIGGALKTLALRAHQKGLELVLDLDPDVPIGLIGDDVRLRQILINLAGNAIKFTEAGEVVIAVRPEAHDGPEPLLHFTVSDTGVGIAPDKLRSIFDPFTQGDNSITRRFGGTGLGLTISARLVAMMGGRIWVESEAGRGSLFHFTAKFKRDISNVPARKSDGLESIFNNLPILLVDDNRSAREVVTRVLRQMGLKPTTVDGAAPARDELRRAAAAGSSYPLVMIDAVMPDTDGFALARQIADEAVLAGPIIFMLPSANLSDDLMRIRGMDNAFYLAKPVLPSELRKVLATAVGHDPAASDVDAGLEKGGAGLSTSVERPTRLHTLLVDDNAFNQKVGVQKLTKMGHKVTVVSGGMEALAAMEAARFDIVFMDLHMRDIDGLEATRRIRQREAGTGVHTPVIAMTARAMKEDRDLCLASGMDDFVSKPIRDADLLRAIQAVAPRSSCVVPIEPPRNAAPPSRDTTRWLERVGGNAKLLAELVTSFRADCPLLLAEIDDSILKNDPGTLCRAAHTLKSMLLFFEATTASEAAIRLETMGRNSDVSGSPETFAKLSVEVEGLLSELASLTGADLP